MEKLLKKNKNYDYVGLKNLKTHLFGFYIEVIFIAELRLKCLANI